MGPLCPGRSPRAHQGVEQIPLHPRHILSLIHIFFFLLPIKVKYLGFLGAFYYCIALIGGSWSTRLSIVMAFLNLILFFGGDFWGRIKSRWKYRESRRAFRQYQQNRQRGPWGQ